MVEFSLRSKGVRPLEEDLPFDTAEEMTYRSRLGCSLRLSKFCKVVGKF